MQANCWNDLYKGMVITFKCWHSLSLFTLNRWEYVDSVRSGRVSKQQFYGLRCSRDTSLQNFQSTLVIWISVFLFSSYSGKGNFNFLIIFLVNMHVITNHEVISKYIYSSNFILRISTQRLLINFIDQVYVDKKKV